MRELLERKERASTQALREKLKKRPKYKWKSQKVAGTFRRDRRYYVSGYKQDGGSGSRRTADIEVAIGTASDLSLNACKKALKALSSQGHGWFSPSMGSLATPIFFVKSSDVDEGDQGKGIGRLMYKKAIGRIRKDYPDGFYLTMDECGWGGTSDEAERVWDSLCRSGMYPCETSGRYRVLYVGPK